MWNGEYTFVLRNLIEKDFKVRYRNMSLGIFWSLLNPLIMMAVLTFVFTQIFSNSSGANYPISVLCALVPLSFFQIAWATGTNSLQDNAALIKKVPVPRQIFPIASVLSNCLHLVIQIALLLGSVLVFGRGLNIYWLWLPVIWGLEIVFVLGLSLVFSALNVYVRDIRYVVEASNTVLFWLVPVFYSFSLIPLRYREVYQFNPVAAVVLMLRNILLEGRPPLAHTLTLLVLVSFSMLGMGWIVFGRLARGFYEHL
ncbi:MAG TPA: ABC transporter permease [Bryobacteraceae bacterium]|nr:ABC transporter permease [Bryobacteraceae bacterium]